MAGEAVGAYCCVAGVRRAVLADGGPAGTSVSADGKEPFPGTGVGERYVAELGRGTYGELESK